MTTLYSQFKTFNKKTEGAIPKISTSSKILLAISIALAIFISFFFASFLIVISLIVLPFTAFRLWLFKRKIQKNASNNNPYYSHFSHSNEQDSSIIEAEYTVMESTSDQAKH